jgi:hypothetical protein
MLILGILIFLIIVIIANLCLCNKKPDCYSTNEYFESAKKISDEKVNSLELFNYDDLTKKISRKISSNIKNNTYIDKMPEMTHHNETVNTLNRNSISEFVNDSRIIEKEIVANRRPIINRSNQIRSSGYSDR